MNTKIFDIVQPKDDWERGYALLEYTRLDLSRPSRKTIIVKHTEVSESLQNALEALCASYSHYKAYTASTCVCGKVGA